MTVPLLLVRHAKAGNRKHWSIDDRLRPLSEAGWAQAHALVDVLAPFHPRRLLSSPYVRCVQTLEPLGEACHLKVEEVDALAEGRLSKAWQLVSKLAEAADGTVVLSTHGDIVPEMLRILAEEHGVRLGADVRWPKGSTWAVEHHKGRFTKAMYLRPPD